MKLIASTLAGLAILALAIYADSKVNVCYNMVDNNFVSDLTNCSNYYVCMNKTAHLGSCQKGFLFNSATQACDYPANVKCPQDICKNPGVHTHAYDNTCTNFFLCFGGTPVVQSCKQGLQYNAATDRCDFAKNVDCLDNMCSPINDIDDINYLRSHAKCDKYYICFNGRPTAFECAKGLAFNTDSKCCEEEKTVNCTLSAASRNIMPYSKMPPQRAPITCPLKGVHFYPNPANPSSYFLCSDGLSVVLTCTPGLVYDQDSESCLIPGFV